jgi:Methylamine utilisation protein MauE
MKKYWPLICLILVAAIAAGAIVWGSQKNWMDWMSYFMGIFLCQFSLLKLFNPIQFADGFQKYDLIAKKSRVYALAYPLIELVLGLSYLAFFLPMATAIVTILILGAGAVGVILALRKGLDVRCACMGTVLDVPLSTVTLTEDLGMVAMSVLLLVYFPQR